MSELKFNTTIVLNENSIKTDLSGKIKQVDRQVNTILSWVFSAWQPATEGLCSTVIIVLGVVLSNI